MLALPLGVVLSGLVELADNLRGQLGHEPVDNTGGNPALRIGLRVVHEVNASFRTNAHQITGTDGDAANEILLLGAVRVRNTVVHNNIFT